MPGYGTCVRWTYSGIDNDGFKLYFATSTLMARTPTQAAADPLVTIETINDPTTTYHRLTSSLSNQTTYFFRLTAFSATKESEFSNERSSCVLVDISSPTAPSDLYASGVSSSAFTLGWTASTDDDGVTGYRLDVSSNSGFSSFVAGYNNLDLGDVTSQVISGLSVDILYYARLRAYDWVGNTSPDSAVFSTTTVIDTSSPTAPGGLYASGVSSSAFTLGWTASTDDVGVTGYRLDVSSNSGFSSFVAGYNNLDLGDVTSQVISGLSVDILYYARLRAYDLMGNTSPDSAVFSTTTVVTDTSPPTVPAGLSANVISYSRINLAWTASTDDVGVTGYRIYRNSIQISTTANTFYADTGLSPSTAYVYRVAAYDAAGNVSGQSSQASATTPVAPPLTPPALSASIFGPNPLRPSRNPGSVVTFRVPSGARVRIYTLVGELIYDQKADDNGQAIWSGVNRLGSSVASGIYIVLIESGKDRRTMRLAVER